MDLKQRLENTLHESMRSGNDVVKRTVRMVISSIKLAEVEKRGSTDDQLILGIIQKEIKSRQEMIEEAKKGNRNDIIEETTKEIVVLETFLPAQLPENELKEIIQKAVSEAGANGISDMGKVMKIVLPQIQGRAPNDKVSKLVREVLGA